MRGGTERCGKRTDDGKKKSSTKKRCSALRDTKDKTYRHMPEATPRPGYRTVVTTLRKTAPHHGNNDTKGGNAEPHITTQRNTCSPTFTAALRRGRGNAGRHGARRQDEAGRERGRDTQMRGGNDATIRGENEAIAE